MSPSTALPESLHAIAEVSIGGDAFLLFLYVLLALLFSFLCSIAEAALLSITPSYIAGLRESNPHKAALLKKLRQDNIDQSLAAILTVNTISHTVGAIGAGAKATAVFGDAWFGVFSGVMTLLILFLSEIIPKTLGALHWRKLAGFTLGYVNVLVKVMYPLIVVSEKLTQWISGGKKPQDFSRDEFVAMADIGQELGQINERESKIIRNLFLFKSVDVTAIMTPRMVMSALKKDMGVTQALAASGQMPFSRLPIYDKDLDSIVGFVLREDLLIAQNQGRGDIKLIEFRREIVSVLSTTPLSRVLETLLEKRQHIVVVVGEYGDTKGLVTLEDVVETLLGIEILDEGDKVEDMQQLARQLWARRAERLGIVIDAV